MIKLKQLRYSKVSMEITNRCNFGCIWCPSSLGEVKDKQMTKEEAFRVIDELSKCGGSELDYLELNVLGEPLMHPDFVEIIQYAHSHNIRVRLITNGSLLSSQNIESILDCHPEILKISLESLDENNFHFIRKTRLNMDKYISNIVNLIKCRIEYADKIPTRVQIDILYISNFYFRKLIGALPNEPALKYIYSNKKRLLTNMLYFLHKLYNNDFSTKDVYRNLSCNFRRIKRGNFSNNEPLYKISDNIIITLKEYYPWISIKNKYPIDKNTFCMVDKMGILADGRIVLCCLDYQGQTEIGNIFNDRLEDVLSAAKEKIDALRRGKAAFAICKNCQGCFSKRHRILKKLKFRFKANT